MGGDPTAHDPTGHDPTVHEASVHGHAGHAHSHGSIRSAERHRRPLAISFVVLAVFMVVEVVAGFATQSLALLSDAGHMLTDVVGMGMALAAIQLATAHRARAQHTFGLYRLEILAVLVNVVLLLGVAAYVIVEAVARFDDPVAVPSAPMLIVAVLGLAANLVAFALLRAGAAESLNIEGAYLEVVADTVGSVGVIVAAIAIAVTGQSWIDPVVGVAIGLFIVPRTLRLGGQALRILTEAAPAHIDVTELQGDLEAIVGVVEVHDLHVWTLTSDMDAATVHLVAADDADLHAVLDRARDLLRDGCGITHATVQIEPRDHVGCAEVGW